MKNRFWAVIMKKIEVYRIKESFCYTWDSKHPEDTREKQSVMVWAIYPKKKDALADVKFRGNCYVKEIFINI